MITNLGNSVFIDAQPDEFQLAAWLKYRTLANSPVPGIDAQTKTDAGAPTIDVGDDGSDIIVTRVQGKIALNRSHCWVVSGRETTDLLQHEQGHYYITYIPYVLALQAIKDLTAPLSTIPARVTGHHRQALMHNAIILQARTVLSQAQARMSQLTSQYDALYPPGTDHSRNGPQQQFWNQRFATSLVSGSPL
jgi:hypothetical protein